MANEVFFDTSGFFAAIDQTDPSHRRVTAWLSEARGKTRPVTTEWILGETCTLLVARKRPHLGGSFLNHIERSEALHVINPDKMLLDSAKSFIRRRADQGFSFVDCLSFCVMTERNITKALTTDEHFRKAGFEPLLWP